MNWITASSRLRLYVANGHSKYKGSELLSMWLERCHDEVTWLLWLRNYVVHNFASHLRWVRALLVRARDSYYHSNHSWYHWATIDPWKSTTASPGPFSWYILVEWRVVTQSQIQALAKGHLLRWCPTGNFSTKFHLDSLPCRRRGKDGYLPHLWRSFLLDVHWIVVENVIEKQWVALVYSPRIMHTLWCCSHNDRCSASAYIDYYTEYMTVYNENKTEGSGIAEDTIDGLQCRHTLCWRCWAGTWVTLWFLLTCFLHHHPNAHDLAWGCSFCLTCLAFWCILACMCACACSTCTGGQSRRWPSCSYTTTILDGQS